MMQLYPQKPSDDHNIEQVLFEITFQKENFSSFSGIPLADISKESNFPEEEEVLFSIGSIFRIDKVQKKGRQVWKIDLTYLESSESPLYKEDGNHVNRIYKLMEDGLPFGSTRMSAILYLSGRLNEAESYCRQQIDYWSRIDPKVLKRQLENDKLFKCLSKIVNLEINEQDHVRDIKRNLEYYYLQLLKVFRDKGDDDGCLFWLEYLRHCNPHFSTSQLFLCYYHILTGEVCEHSGQLAKAYRKYIKALHISVALSKGQDYHALTQQIIINIANISLKFCPGKHEPLQLYEKVLRSFGTSTPFSHPRIGAVRLNIADYYRNISQFKLALEEYEDCLQIFVRSLPLDHVNIGLAYYGIGLCYQLINHKNDIVQAISYLEKAETIFKKHLISDHWRLIRTEQTLRRLKNKFKPNL
jgi:tetratricopeptide (TPR) repeat protein